jgi:hypothetical protein
MIRRKTRWRSGDCSRGSSANRGPYKNPEILRELGAKRIRINSITPGFVDAESSHTAGFKG